jgi:hypothetical protein
VNAVACDPASVSPAETVVFGLLVHNWLVKVRPPGRVSCLLKQPCQECTHGYHGICTSLRVSTRAEHLLCVSTQRLLRGICLLRFHAAVAACRNGWLMGTHPTLIVDAVAMSLAEAVVFGVLVHNWLVKVRPPGRVSCLIKQPCQDCTHGRGFCHNITVT